MRDKQIVETPKISVVWAGSGNLTPQIEPCVILLAHEPARTEEDLQPNIRSREAFYVPSLAAALPGVPCSSVGWKLRGQFAYNRNKHPCPHRCDCFAASECCVYLEKW